MDATGTYSAKVTGAGTATITIQTPSTQIWTVTQVSAELATAPRGSTCNLRKNGFLITPMIATGDAASGDPPVVLLPSDALTIEWAGCTPNDIARATIFYSYQT